MERDFSKDFTLQKSSMLKYIQYNNKDIKITSV